MGNQKIHTDRDYVELTDGANSLSFEVINGQRNMVITLEGVDECYAVTFSDEKFKEFMDTSLKLLMK